MWVNYLLADYLQRQSGHPGAVEDHIDRNIHPKTQPSQVYYLEAGPPDTAAIVLRADGRLGRVDNLGLRYVRPQGCGPHPTSKRALALVGDVPLIPTERGIPSRVIGDAELCALTGAVSPAPSAAAPPVAEGCSYWTGMLPLPALPAASPPAPPPVPHAAPLALALAPAPPSPRPTPSTALRPVASPNRASALDEPANALVALASAAASPAAAKKRKRRVDGPGLDHCGFTNLGSVHDLWAEWTDTLRRREIERPDWKRGNDASRQLFNHKVYVYRELARVWDANGGGMDAALSATQARLADCGARKWKAFVQDHTSVLKRELKDQKENARLDRVWREQMGWPRVTLRLQSC